VGEKEAAGFFDSGIFEFILKNSGNCHWSCSEVFVACERNKKPRSPHGPIIRQSGRKAEQPPDLRPQPGIRRSLQARLVLMSRGETGLSGAPRVPHALESRRAQRLFPAPLRRPLSRPRPWHDRRQAQRRIRPRQRLPLRPARHPRSRLGLLGPWHRSGPLRRVGAIRDLIPSLLEHKANTRENEHIPRIAPLDEFLRERIQQLSEQVPALPSARPDRPSLDPLLRHEIRCRAPETHADYTLERVRQPDTLYFESNRQSATRFVSQ